ncbi:hypothetical protein H310_06755 [Aphanomyces invadans]|uniref:CDP-alcohol phosphatidyltransferase n=1 Tax=Aphanomyces invadans TaxID=157072 RepID=A0A024U6A5_9STRA|nr:hypothetical protein H310_06755 [Aphanomyces invadans]ETW01153.1 hypothetical protein H310_06755 [Aphanomyces invadans]|eukprot:XP_008870151.1 hypothetical protein H310_06755 [Aphanomyces invadans]
MAHHYVSARGAAQLPKYKYSGNDKSLLYNYFLSPLAQRIVDTFFPPWLAPNTITTGGLGLVALSHLILAYYAPTLDGVAPPAAYLFSAAALFWYQVLDVTDGKQARKTGNSSPLGLLFDHGCDAVNVVFSACTMTSTMLMGPSIWSLGLLLSPSCVFLFATWEEYYTGTLDLGLINGPNEGLAIMYIIYAITAMTGPAFWTQPCVVYPALPNNAVFVIATAFGAGGQCLVNVFNVAQAVKPSEFVGALGRIAPFIAFLGASLAYGVYSPSNILASHPRLFLWTIGLISCKMVMHIMLAHLCEEPYWLVRKSFAVIVAIVGLFYAGLIPVALEEAAFFAVFALVVAVYAHMVFFVVVDMTTILKIKVFTVKEKQ